MNGRTSESGNALSLDHLSYSTLSSFTSCPRKVYLEKIKKAEPLPAWFFVVGSAVHRFIEYSISPYATRTVDSFFHEEVVKARLIEPATSLWLHGGSKEAPVVEGLALEQARACSEAALEFLEDMEIWEVEPDITGHLPGCSMPIKAFPDMIGEHKKHGPVIIDWKTGSSKPKDNLQLETYNCLMKHGEMVHTSSPTMSSVEFKGLFVMLKPGTSKARPVKLIETPESMGQKFAEIERRIKANAWPAIPQFNCRFCVMRPNCKLGGGVTERSAYYDRVEHDGGIPF